MKGPFLLRTRSWGLGDAVWRSGVWPAGSRGVRRPRGGKEWSGASSRSAPQQRWVDQPSESLGKCRGRRWAAPARDHSSVLGSAVVDGALAQQASAWEASEPRCPKRVWGGPSPPQAAQGASEAASLHPVRADVTWGTTKSCLGPGKRPSISVHTQAASGALGPRPAGQKEPLCRAPSPGEHKPPSHALGP